MTLGRWIEDRARITPGRVAIDFEDRLVTYAELDAAADAFAADFAARGLVRGDRVASLTGNSPEHVAVFFACAKLGLILLPLSWRLSPPELGYKLENAEPALFLVDGPRAGLAEATGSRTERLV
ncbi:MAG: long-chain fatty acid--CoA ligase, partial [Actinobacteria bacterium]